MNYQQDHSERSYTEVRLLVVFAVGFLFLAVGVTALLWASDWEGNNLPDAWKQEYGLSTNVYAATNLVGWWQMNGTNNTDPALDRSGNGINGTLSGFPSVAYGPGLFSNALYFTSNGTVTFPTTNSILNTTTNQFTFSAWFLATNATTNPATIVTWSDAATNSWTIGAGTNGAAVLAFLDAFGDVQSVSPSTNAISLYDGNWHQVAATYNTNQVAKVYVDGETQASGTITNWMTGPAASFTFGVPNASVTNQSYAMDEVRLYNRALGTNEITQLPFTYTDLNGSGLSVYDDYLEGLDPVATTGIVTSGFINSGLTAYYGNNTPTLTKTGGDLQTVAANSFAANTLVVHVTNSLGTALAGAPITFTIPAGSDGGVAQTSGGTTTTSLSLTTDSSGNVAVYYESGPDTFQNNTITATAVTATGNVSINFTAFCGVQTGLVAWYRADSDVTTDTNGNVSTWEDQSPVGNNAVQNTSGNRPALVSNGLNGKPVVRFNSANSQYLGVPDNSTIDVSNYTIICALNPGSNNSNYSMIVSKPYYAGMWSSPYDSYQMGIAPTGILYTVGSLSSTYNTGTGTSTSVVSQGPLLVTGSYGNGVFQLYTKGTLMGSTTSTNSPLSYNGETANLAIGAATANPAQYFYNGDMAEVLIYNRALTATEQKQVEIYLADKYGLYHPDADWPLSYPSDVQAMITDYQWTKSQADAYVAFQNSNPTMVTDGLVAWYRADSEVTTDTNGNVSTWGDQTPIGNNGVQNTAGNRPALVSNGLNGEPVVRFNSANHQYLGVPDNSTIDVSNYTIICALNPSSNNSAYSIAVSKPYYSSGWSSPYDSYEFGIAPTGIPYMTGSISSTSNMGISSTTSIVSQGPLLVTGSYGNGVFQIYTKGALMGSATVTNSPLSYNGQTANLTIGAATTNPAQYFYNGDMAEVLLYNRVLTTTEQEQAEVYLADKYGLYHPHADWPLSYPSDVQAMIMDYQWTKSQADAYVTFQNSDPTMVTDGLVAWYRADSEVTTDTNGNVSTWGDQTSIGNNAVQNTAGNRPALVSNGLNGKPVVRFNSANHQYLGVPDNSTIDVSNYTIVGVFNPGTTNSDYSIMVSKPYYASAWSSPYDSYQMGIAPTGILYTVGSLSSTYNTGTGTSTSVVSQGPLLVTGSYGNGVFQLYTKGTLMGSTTSTNSPLSYNGQTANFAIGAATTNPAQDFYNGDMAELLIYNRKLTILEREQAEIYLANKYGISYPCTLTMTSGDNQTNMPGNFTWHPLIVLLEDSSGVAIPNTAVTFTVSQGGGMLATTNTGTPSLSTTLQVITNSSGQAQIYYQQPSTGSVTSQITATTGGQTVSFSETTLPTGGLTVWFRADTGVMTTNGSVVQWNDQSGNGYNITQSPGSSAPAPGTDPTTSLPVVQFNGSQWISSGATLSSVNDVTIFVVASTSTPSSSEAMVDIGAGYNSLTTRALAYCGGDESFVNGWPNGGFAQFNNGGQVAQTTHLTLNEVTYSNSANQANFYSNGNADGDVTVSTGTATSGLSLGSLSYYNSYDGWNGNIAEVLIYNSVLTTAERQEVEAYLANKYEIPPVITSPVTAIGDTETPFSYTIAASDGPISYGATGLPSGLSIDTATGVITGTPSVTGTFTVLLSATNSGGTNTSTLTMTVYGAIHPTITSPTMASGTEGAAFNYAIVASNEEPPTTFSITNGALPTGLSLNSSGVISGTPTTSGTFTVTLNATNPWGTGTANLTLTIYPSLPVTSGLAAWFNADTGITTSGESVTGWNDQSGNGYNVTQVAGSTAPTLGIDSTSGNSVLSFNSSQYLTTNAQLTGANSVTVIVVSSSTSPNISGTQVVVGNAYTSTSARAFGDTSGNQSYGNGTTNVNGGPVAPNSLLNVNTMTYNQSSGTTSFYTQGIANGTNNLTSGTLNAGLTIGNLLNYVSFDAWNGNIAEVIVYNRVLTTQERQEVEQSLANKYGLYCPGASWISAYSTAVQIEINRNQWNESQANSYVALQNANPYMLTTGLLAWYKADSGIGLGMGSSVTSWADQTGNAPLVQTTDVGQPVLVNNDSNDEPAIRFSGSQSLISSNFLGAGVNADMTVITVEMTTTSTNKEYGIYLGNGATGQVRGSGYNNALEFYDTSGSSVSGAAAPTNGIFTAEAVTVNPTLTSGNVAFYRDGSEIQTGTVSGLKILTSGVAIGNSWKGDIAEVLVYDHQLSSAELSQVNLYIANKYGLYDPNASWILSYPTSVQTLIYANQWNQVQADEYVQISQVLPVTTGLTAWYKADNGVIQGGGSVTTWKDSGFFHYDITQTAGTNAPTYGTDPTTGMPVVQFNGSQWISSQSTQLNVNDVTIITVASTPTPSSTGAIVDIGYGYGTTSTRALAYHNGKQSFVPGWPTIINGLGYASFYDGGSTASSAGLNINTVTYSQSNGLASFYSNGIANGTNTAGAEPVSYGVGLGSLATFENYDGWNGNIAEVLIYNRVLNSTELQQIDSYLTAKYVSLSSAPTISPNGGSFSTSTNVILSGATSPAIIRYTLDGSLPTDNSTQYTAPITLTQDTTINCSIFQNGVQISRIATAQFWIGDTYHIGIPDAWQLEYFGQVEDINPNALSPGGSGLTYMQDYLYGYNPTMYSTNGDGLSDLLNYQLGYAGNNYDINGYGLTNAQQLALGLDPFDIGVNPSQPTPPSDPGDTVPPVMTLTQPANATPEP